ncbi:MAG: hypothetical protein ABSD59_05965 [Terracidiphilus sp.]
MEEAARGAVSKLRHDRLNAAGILIERDVHILNDGFEACCGKRGRRLTANECSVAAGNKTRRSERMPRGNIHILGGDWVAPRVGYLNKRSRQSMRR